MRANFKKGCLGSVNVSYQLYFNAQICLSFLNSFLNFLFRIIFKLIKIDQSRRRARQTTIIVSVHKDILQMFKVFVE